MFETRFFSTVLLPVVLGLIMVGIGTSLTPADFRNIFRYPKGVFVGLLGQMILLPLVALAIARVSPLPQEFKAGLILVAACPGGATSNLIVHLFRGNVAMSISFTIVNSFLTLISIPAWVYLALWIFRGKGQAIPMPLADSLVHILFMTVIPCTIGIWLGSRFPLQIAKYRKIMDGIMPILMAFAMVAAVFFEKKNDGLTLSADLFFNVFPWVFLLNVGGLGTGYVLAWLFGLGNRNRMTVSVEVGMQNTGLAIAIATSAYMLNDRSLAIPAAVYAMFTFFTAVGWAAFLRRKAISFSIRKSRRDKPKN